MIENANNDLFIIFNHLTFTQMPSRRRLHDSEHRHSSPPSPLIAVLVDELLALDALSAAHSNVVSTVVDILSASVSVLSQEILWLVNSFEAHSEAEAHSHDLEPRQGPSSSLLQSTPLPVALGLADTTPLASEIVSLLLTGNLHVTTASAKLASNAPSSSCEYCSTVLALEPKLIALLGGSDLSKRKRTRTEPPNKQSSASVDETSPLQARLKLYPVQLFLSNAFRGPHVSQTTMLRTCGEEVLISSRRLSGELCGVDGENVQSFYRKHPDGAELLRVHATQMLCNGIFEHFRNHSRTVLQHMCATAGLSTVAVTIATTLELANFLTCAVFPPPVVAQNLLVQDGGSADAAGGGGEDHAVSSHGRAVALAAIGNQSTSLEAARHRLDEIVGPPGQQMTVKELALSMCHIAGLSFNDILEALAAHFDAASDVQTSSALRPQLPTKEAYLKLFFSTDDTSAQALQELHASLLRSQFPSDQHTTDSHLVQQRAQHVAAIPPSAMFLLVRKTSTKDPYEQFLIRFWRLPFSRCTTRAEMVQWLWSSELFDLAMNLLSYHDTACRIAALQACRLSRKKVDELLEASTRFVNNAKPLHRHDDRVVLKEVVVYLLRHRASLLSATDAS